MENIQEQLKSVLNSLNDIKEGIKYCETDILDVLETDESFDYILPKLNINVIDSNNQDVDIINIDEIKINPNGVISIILNSKLYNDWDIEIKYGNEIKILNTIVYDESEFNDAIYVNRNIEYTTNISTKTFWFSIELINTHTDGLDYRVFKEHLGDGYEIILVPELLVNNYSSESKKIKFEIKGV